MWPSFQGKLPICPFSAGPVFSWVSYLDPNRETPSVAWGSPGPLVGGLGSGHSSVLVTGGPWVWSLRGGSAPSPQCRSALGPAPAAQFRASLRTACPCGACQARGVAGVGSGPGACPRLCTCPQLTRHCLWPDPGAPLTREDAPCAIALLGDSEHNTSESADDASENLFPRIIIKS